MNLAAPSVSIVVPVYNEVPSIHSDTLTPRIQQLLGLLRAGDELLLVDGGSADSSWPALLALANHPQVLAIQSSKGRARQMNAGASEARGDVLLFLHADTVLNAAAWAHFLATLKLATWGRFDVEIQGKSKWLPVVAWFMNHRSRFSKISTGDQALFLGRTLFKQVGGFPEQTLMEDIELCKQLKRLAPNHFVPISTPVQTSGRRWDTHGAWKTIVLMWRFRYQYWRGVAADELARQYADSREKIPLLVALFAKYPQPSCVKTRLEPLLGAEQCALFARYLLLSTLDKLHGVNVALWTDGGTAEQWAKLLNGRKVSSHIQPVGHLGLRMQTAVETHINECEVLVLLGPDAVQFTVNDLHRLISAAKKQGIAFVPAHDGGYVALACTRCVPVVFSESIDWGTPSVAAQTKAALLEQGLQADWLEAQLDVDEPADLQRAIDLAFVPSDWVTRYSESQI